MCRILESDDPKIHKLHAFHFKIVRRMFFIERLDEEDIEADMKRSTRTIMARLTAAGGTKWDRKYHGMM